MYIGPTDLTPQQKGDNTWVCSPILRGGKSPLVDKMTELIDFVILRSYILVRVPPTQIQFTHVIKLKNRKNDAMKTI